MNFTCCNFCFHIRPASQDHILLYTLDDGKAITCMHNFVTEWIFHCPPENIVASCKQKEKAPTKGAFSCLCYLDQIDAMCLWHNSQDQKDNFLDTPKNDSL